MDRITRRDLLRGSLLATAAMLPVRGDESNAAEAVSLVRVDAGNPINSFDPDRALGSSIDVLPRGVIDKIYTKQMIEKCLSAGWGPITYRNHAELGIQALHWNAEGTWSDPHNKRGYFTGSAEPDQMLRRALSYPLPHRGDTRNGGAGEGYSRLTDGNPNTYWKSNPYLSAEYTGETGSLHPQWIIVDMGALEDISAIRIHWSNPYARSFEIHYWKPKSRESSGKPDRAAGNAMEDPAGGDWIVFSGGTFRDAKGGSETLRLAPAPVPTRFIRIWMTESSRTYSTHGPDDRRSALGYAITEIDVGNFGEHGAFIDLCQHSPDQDQTATYCSSTDPWHRAEDADEQGEDHTGFDLFFTSGITNSLPAMIPVSVLYGTPDDAAAQITYLKKRGYPIAWVEMGEEPDGQNVLPEDYAALYLQVAAAIHKVDPGLKLGGPVFEGVNEDIQVWRDTQGRVSWTGRFVDYLKTRNRLADLSFFSFEHYPFAPCDIVWTDLYREPSVMSHILDVWRRDGVPADVPLMVTESNLSWDLSGQMSELFSALWLADNVGSFFEAGGAAFFHSPIQPEPVSRGCHGWATWGNFIADRDLKIRGYTSQYFAGQLINLEWVKHGSGVHQMFRALCDAKDNAGHTLVTSYAVKRPDGDWALLLVNRDQSNAHRVRIEFAGNAGASLRFAGRVRVATFGSEQYVWHSDGPNSSASPDGPQVATDVAAGRGTIFTLPKASVSVLRGKVSGS